MDRRWWRKPKTHKFEELKDRASRSRADELEYIKVDAVCLGCGARSRVKVSRLGQKLRCRNCHTIMHMGADGSWRLGPPSDEVKGGSKWIRAPQPRYWGLTDLTRVLPILRNRVFLISACVALVLLVGVAVANLTSVNLPPALLGRATFLCDALLEGQRSDFKRCAAFTTRGEALRVYDEIQYRLSREPRQSKPEFSLDVLYEHDDQGTACVVAEFYAPQQKKDGDTRPPRRSKRKKLFSIVLLWTKSSRGGWLLDGKQTADDLQFSGGSARRS